MTQVALRDVCVQARDQIRPGERTDLKNVGLESVEAGTGAFVDGELSKTPEDPRAASFHFDERHVLYGKLRPYLNKVVAPNFEGKCSTELVPLLPGDSLDRLYLAYFLRSKATVEAVVARTAGARMPRADMSHLLGLRIPLPTLLEQKRVVDLLSRAEGIVRLRREAQRKAAELVPALFLDMFGDPASNPKGWPVVELGDLIVDGPQNGLYKHKSLYGDGTPILRIDGFYDGVVNDLASLQRVRLTPEEIERYGLTSGEIVINRVNSPEYLGKSALIPDLHEPTVFESNMMRLRLDTERIAQRFAIVSLQMDATRKQILASAKHAINQSSINQQDVRALRFSLPPIALQNRFSAKAGAVRGIAAQQATALATAEATFDALLHQSFAIS